MCASVFVFVLMYMIMYVCRGGEGGVHLNGIVTGEVIRIVNLDEVGCKIIQLLLSCILLNFLLGLSLVPVTPECLSRPAIPHAIGIRYDKKRRKRGVCAVCVIFFCLL